MGSGTGQGVGGPSSGSGWWSVGAEAVAVLLVLPLVGALATSLAAPSGESDYASWWGSARGWSAMGRTLGLASASATAAAVVAWVLVSAASRVGRGWAVPAAFAACLPMLVPSSLLATAWIVALSGTGVSPYGFWGASAALAFRYFGVAALVLAFAQRRETGWPAERVFRVPRAAAAVHLGLRSSLRPLAAGWLLVALVAMNDHIMPGMLLVSTYGTQVLIQYSALLDPAGAVALAAPMGLVGAALAAGALCAARGAWPRTAEGWGEPARGGLGGVGAGAVVAGVLGLALAAPVAVLAHRAGSAEAVAEALGSAGEQVRQTARVALAGGLVTGAASALLAARWVAARRRGERTAAPVVVLNLTVPPSLLAIGWLELAGAVPLGGWRDSAWWLVAGYAARFVPVATLLLYVLWREEPWEPVLAARVHGVTAGRTAWSVVWPGRWWAVAAAGLMGAVLAATELEVSVLVAPPGGSTLGVRLYTLIHTATEGMVSALALGILVVVAPGIVALGLALVWRGRRRRTV